MAVYEIRRAGISRFATLNVASVPEILNWTFLQQSAVSSVNVGVKFLSETFPA
jgi:hypothetical protein